MDGTRVYISGMGIISPLGKGVLATLDAIKTKRCGISLPDLFTIPENRIFPVGQVLLPEGNDTLPRTHRLALIAASEAMAKSDNPPDAIVLGVTTGGMLTTELKLKNSEQSPDAYRYHSVSSVAEELAKQYNCKGPVITISTACSSGTAAIKIALEMLRQKFVKRVLAGGADSLCRLTYYGFSSLQLIDPDGAIPLDAKRKGISVAEGAAMLLLTSDKPKNAIAEVLGGGLSCDAYHPTAPHPQGTGARAAMKAAISDAQIGLSDIDYINLHGTGTIDNDLSEAFAINSLFTSKKPFLSSVKGAFGHSLAASGAIEAVVCAMAVHYNIIPGNTGCKIYDLKLQLEPLLEPLEMPVRCVLSNSFGFGGNNASIVITKPEEYNCPEAIEKQGILKIAGSACLTGIGDTEKTLSQFLKGKSCKGFCSIEEISNNLPKSMIRRLKRLPRIALSLAIEAQKKSNTDLVPSSVFVGTGWGSLSETYDFLTRLHQSNEEYSSPTDFIGSVHNSSGSQIAMYYKSQGANITASGGDYSFEQAVMMATLLSRDIKEPLMVLGADEFHKDLSMLFDRSLEGEETGSDGGGAFLLTKNDESARFSIKLLFYERAYFRTIESLVNKLGGKEKISSRYGIIMAGIPKAEKDEANSQLKNFILLSAFSDPVIDYRKFFGQFATSAAVAAVITLKILEKGFLSGQISGRKDVCLDNKSGLILGLGKFITAIEINRNQLLTNKKNS